MKKLNKHIIIILLFCTFLLNSCMKNSRNLNQATFSPMNIYSKHLKEKELLTDFNIRGIEKENAKEYSNILYSQISNKLERSYFSMNKIGYDILLVAKISDTQDYNFTLKPRFAKQLDQLASILKSNKQTIIELSGHTDSIGGENSNILKSRHRINSVSKYLIDKGVIPQRMFIFGAGESRWIAPNATIEGRDINNRIEIKISPIVFNIKNI